MFSLKTLCTAKHSHNITWYIIDNIASHQTLPPAGNLEWETGMKQKKKQNIMGKGSTDVFVLTATLWKCHSSECIRVLSTTPAYADVIAYARAQCRKGLSNHNSSVAILCYSGYRARGVCALQSSSLPQWSVSSYREVEQMGNGWGLTLLTYSFTILLLEMMMVINISVQPVHPLSTSSIAWMDWSAQLHSL